MTKNSAKPFATFGLILAFCLGGTLAQTAAMTMNVALKSALEKGPDIATSRASLENAQADLKSAQADPTTLALPLAQAQNTADLNAAQLNQTKLSVAQNVTTAYLNLFEGQENIKLLEAQLALDSRSLEVAKAQLAAKNGTQLNVSKADSALAASKQNLSDAKAQLPILSNRLEVLLGTNAAGNLTVGAPPAFKEIKVDANGMEAKLEQRLPSVLQVAQGLTVADLNVKLADNDYTPPATLRDAKTAQDNAKRNLVTVKANAVTSLRDANRAVANALEQVKIAKVNQANGDESLTQDQAKFKSGTISRYQLQQTEVATLRSNFAAVQASDSYMRALSALGVSSGVDVAGLVGGQ